MATAPPPSNDPGVGGGGREPQEGTLDGASAGTTATILDNSEDHRTSRRNLVLLSAFCPSTNLTGATVKLVLSLRPSGDVTLWSGTIKPSSTLIWDDSVVLKTTDHKNLRLEVLQTYTTPVEWYTSWE